MGSRQARKASGVLVPTPTSAPTPPGTTASPSRRRSVGLIPYASAGLEAQLTFGDDRLVRLQPLIDHDVVANPPAGGHRTLIDGRIRLDDENELTVLACLHRLIWDDDGIRQCG